MRRWKHPVDGLELSVGEVPGTAPTVLFQHGLLGDMAQTFDIRPKTLPNRWLTVEMRGHGGSPLGPVEALSLKRFRDDLLADWQIVGERPIVGGASMGAALATMLAAKTELRGLMLVRPAWLDAPSPPNLAANREVGALVAEHPGEAGEKLFAATETAARLRAIAPGNLASFQSFFSRRPQSETAALLSAIAADGPDLPGGLEALDVPALVVAMAEDEVHPVALAEEAARRLPRAKLVHVPVRHHDETGHFAALHAAIAQFISELD
jgi:pimeloyl-ACP methyl ester carboxylesterase